MPLNGTNHDSLPIDNWSECSDAETDICSDNESPVASNSAVIEPQEGLQNHAFIGDTNDGDTTEDDEDIKPRKENEVRLVDM